MLPLGFYYFVETYKSRATEELDLKKELVRDLALEKTFYRRSTLDTTMGDIYYWITVKIGSLLSNFDKGASTHAQNVTTDKYEDLLSNHHDYLEDQKYENKFFFSFPRAMCRANGDHTLLLYLYGALPLRQLSELVIISKLKKE